MRKVYMFMSLSLDGYFEGPNHDISWHRIDDEVNKFAIRQLRETDLFLWGRRIYQLMEGYWPRAAEDPSTSKDNREIARLINNTPKMVFSRTLDAVRETKNWRNVKLSREVKPAEIRRLKTQPGKRISVGGADLARSLVKEGLIDEFRFMVMPVAVGKGTPIFDGIEKRLNLKLVKTREFNSGNVLVCYIPVYSA
jgi:dihydrofolate reductase